MSQNLRHSLRYSRSSPDGKTLLIPARASPKVETARPTRPPPIPHPAGHSSATTQTDSSVSQIQSLSVQHPEYVPPLLSGIRIHILPTKLDDTLADYRRKITTLGGKLVPLPPLTLATQEVEPDKPALPIDYPHVVLTALKGRPRLSRLLNEYMVDYLDIVDVAWIDKVWQTAQDWVWGQPVPSVLGRRVSSLNQGTEAVKNGIEDETDDTTLLMLQVATPPVPDLPDRDAYRIPKTSSMVTKRIRDRESLAVCEPAEVAVCLKTTIAQAVELSRPPMGKRKRSDEDSLDAGLEYAKKVKTSDPAAAAHLRSLAKGFSMKIEGDLPEYLGNLLSDPRQLVDNKRNVSSETDLRIEETVCTKRKKYGKLGRTGSTDIEHPEQDIQLLAMSNAEQREEEPQVIEGVKTLRPLPYDIELANIPNLSIKRCSPLLCVNDDIVSYGQDNAFSTTNRMNIHIPDKCHQADLFETRIRRPSGKERKYS